MGAKSWEVTDAFWSRVEPLVPASSLSDLMLPDRLISRSEMNRGDFGWSQVVFS